MTARGSVRPRAASFFDEIGAGDRPEIDIAHDHRPDATRNAANRIVRRTAFAAQDLFAGDVEHGTADRDEKRADAEIEGRTLHRVSGLSIHGFTPMTPMA
jgi:hypothetical protein